MNSNKLEYSQSPATRTGRGRSEVTWVVSRASGRCGSGQARGLGESCPLTCHRSLGATQAARPNRNASSHLCTELFNTGEEGRKPSQEKGGAPPLLLATPDALCPRCPACPTPKISLNNLSFQTSCSFCLGAVTRNSDPKKENCWVTW